MAITDRHSLPISIGIESASPHEVTLAENCVENIITKRPEKLIGDKAYDSDKLDYQLHERFGLEMIAPHRKNKKHPTQDGRPLRRYSRRWTVERFFAWMGNFRRTLIRWERKDTNYLGFVRLACIIIMMRYA